MAFQSLEESLESLESHEWTVDDNVSALRVNSNGRNASKIEQIGWTCMPILYMDPIGLTHRVMIPYAQEIRT